MKKANISEFEKVLLIDNTNGARVETYVIKGKKNSGDIVINGGAAHHIKKGDEIIIMAFEVASKPKKPRIIILDNQNKVRKIV